MKLWNSAIFRGWKSALRLAVVAASLSLLLISCHPKSCCFEPIICASPTDFGVERLPSPFPPLDIVESKTDWGKELEIGLVFAKEMDLYRALTSFKRARILIPRANEARIQQIDYEILLTYYLAGKYQEVVERFERSSLTTVTTSFPAFSSLITLLEDSYYQDGRCDQATLLFQTIEKYSPETAQDVKLSRELMMGEVSLAKATASTHPKGDKVLPFLNSYCCCAKSVKKAQFLQAIVPGAGYAYVGQNKTAFTSFLLNALFTIAAYQFFDRGYWAAGIFTTSLEFGWYFGGINGAGLAAKEHNELIYARKAKRALCSAELFPVMRLEFGF